MISSGGSNGLAELGAGHIKHEFDERLKNYLDGAINDELNGSPDLAAVFGNGNGKKDVRRGEQRDEMNR